jgi:hypothetical protein
MKDAKEICEKIGHGNWWHFFVLLSIRIPRECIHLLPRTNCQRIGTTPFPTGKYYGLVPQTTSAGNSKNTKHMSATPARAWEQTRSAPISTEAAAWIHLLLCGLSLAGFIERRAANCCCLWLNRYYDRCACTTHPPTPFPGTRSILWTRIEHSQCHGCDSNRAAHLLTGPQINSIPAL